MPLRPFGYPTANLRLVMTRNRGHVLQQEWITHSGQIGSSVPEWRDVPLVDEDDVKPGSIAPLVEDMCPNCVTPWKCNGPHIQR